MIFEDVLRTTESMQDLQKKTEINKNRAIQENTDKNYKLLLLKVNSFVNVIDYLYSDLFVSKNQNILSSLLRLMEVLENVLETGLASYELVVKADEIFKDIQMDMKKEWNKLYDSLTHSTVTTLEAIHSIDPYRVDSCLQKIQQAKVWNLNVENYKTMKSGLNESNQLIVSLGLDDGIISFLQNTNSGKATLFDLNEKVLEWIKKEKLERKIRISFVKNK